MVNISKGVSGFEEDIKRAHEQLFEKDVSERKNRVRESLDRTIASNQVAVAKIRGKFAGYANYDFLRNLKSLNPWIKAIEKMYGPESGHYRKQFKDHCKKEMASFGHSNVSVQFFDNDVSRSFKADPDDFAILNLGVEKPYRRQRIGTSLISFLLNIAKDSNSLHAYIGTSELSGSEKIFKRQGFHYVLKTTPGNLETGAPYILTAKKL